MRFILSLLLIVALFTITPSQSQAQQTDLINEQIVLRLHQQLSYFSEGDTRLSLSEAQAQLANFSLPQNKHANYGNQEQGLWLYTRLTNVTDSNEWVIDATFSQLDHIDFYLLQNGQLTLHSEQGKLSRYHRSRLPAFHITLPIAGHAELFIRIQSTASLFAPFDIQSAAKYQHNQLQDSLLWGLFYGSLLVLALVNLINFISSRNTSLLFYVFYAGTVFLWQFVWGGHVQLFLPDAISYWLAEHTDIFFTLIGISSGLFSYSFCDVSKRTQSVRYAMNGVMGALILLAISSMLNLFGAALQHNLVYFTSLAALLVYISAGVMSINRRQVDGLFFILAWALLGVCATIGVLTINGILSANAYTTHFFQLGLIIQASFFSLALLEKTRVGLQQEVQQASRDLRHNMQMVEEQNVRLDLARKDALTASQVKSQFVAHMSHEIRSPLNAIMGFTQELQHAQLPTQQAEQVAIINSAAQSLTAIVNDILDLSKIEAGKISLVQQPFSSNELLKEVVGIMSRMAQARGLHFVYQSAPLPDKLIGDALRIKQVLTNLLSNAIKFTAKGHVSLHTRGEITDDGHFAWHMYVKDTGIGISKEDQDKLFDAFSQVDDALNRQYQGTGLGLNISRKLTTLMGGKISVSSTPDKGSCFCVKLNVRLPDNYQPQAVVQPLKGLNVALYDEYPPNREATAQQLQQAGAQVDSFDSIATMQTANKQWNIVFVCLTAHNQAQHNHILTALAGLPTWQRYVLYNKFNAIKLPSPIESCINEQLRLPLTPEKIAALQQKPIDQTLPNAHQKLLTLPALNILAVDDMPMNLHLLKTWIGKSPAALTLANSGPKAIEACQQQAFDLILMDVQMPGMDGLETTKQIRRTQLNIGTPVIAVTAHAFKQEKEKLLAAGMDDYLPKPLALDELIRVIDLWCDTPPLDGESPQYIDWQQCLEKSALDADAANSLLAMLLAELDSFSHDIQQHWQQNDFAQLALSIHKLLGACRYTGLPMLEASCYEIDIQLAARQYSLLEEHIPTLLHTLTQCREQISQHLAEHSASRH